MFIISGDNVTVYDDQFEAHTFDLKDFCPDRDRIVALLEQDATNKVLEIVSPKHRIVSYFSNNPRVAFVDRTMQLDGRQLQGSDVDAVFDFAQRGLPYQHVIEFIVHCRGNPSYRAVTELYQFARANDIVIRPDGMLVVFKRVGRKYDEISELDEYGCPSFEAEDPSYTLVDLYTKSIVNDPGSVVSMPRNEVNEDPNQTCSAGLHVCSRSYLPHYGASDGNDVVAVLVDPADVVAVPKDYNNAKMRVCKYEVLAVLPKGEHDLSAFG